MGKMVPWKGPEKPKPRTDPPPEVLPKVEPKEETIQPPRPKPPKELKTTNKTGDGVPISLGDYKGG